MDEKVPLDTRKIMKKCSKFSWQRTLKKKKSTGRSRKKPLSLNSCVDSDNATYVRS